MKKKAKMKFNRTIFDLSILDLIETEFKKYKISDYYDYECDLIIRFNQNDITDDCLSNLNFPYYRPWNDTDVFSEKIELALRYIIGKIKEFIEYDYLNIGRIFVESDNQIEHTEIQIVKNGLYDSKSKRKKLVKIYLSIHFLDNNYISKIVDPIEYFEDGFYIDERNNNKSFYNSLLLKKEQGENLDIDSLSEQEWKQLFLKEKVSTRELASLYDVLENVVTKTRKKFIPSVKQYDDEYLLYNVMFYGMKISDYYSNFCIPLLEQMKAKKINVIYEYLNLDYHELFHTEEELKRQKEIEKDNLLGKKYVMPLSGVLLKKFYYAIKNHQLDRKFLKNNWFNISYGPMFLESFLEHVEQSHILDLYESGGIYAHASFKTYQELYKKLNLIESERLNEQILEKVPLLESKEHIKKKKPRRICPPRDYVELAKVKNKVGITGEELVYNYEIESLKGYPELQKKIRKVSKEDENAGYDIESYDSDGKVIYIEVKTNTTDVSNRIKFYISKTEDEFISSNENAYIYYVYDLKNPKLRVINQKTYLGYYKKAVNYEIDQEIITSQKNVQK